MSARLDGKVAIVTGGASGIGLAIAKGFATEGARVCIADLGQERCAEAAKAVGSGAFGHALDVRDVKSIGALVDRVVAVAGGLDVLVNCAGVFGMQVLTEITEEEFDRIFGINARGLLFMIQAASRRMIEQKRGGAIISIASDAGRRGSPGAAVYSASKAAVIGITQAAALELIQHDIRVNAIAPGAVRTPMWNDVEREYSRNIGTEVGGAENMMVAGTPAGRMSIPEEYAGPAIFLASNESSYVVGQTLSVNGGMLLH